MKTILLIEDDVALSWLLEKILQPNYKVVIAKDGFEAWVWLSEGNVCDLIVSDLNLPALQGTEILENLKTGAMYDHIPVIIVSGLEESKDKCLKLGAMAYLVKPFNPYELLEEIRLAVDLQPQ